MAVAPQGDTMALRVDKMLASMRSGQSACPVLIKTSLSLVTSTTAGILGSFTYLELAVTDDFASLAQQFNEFKVKCMRFRVCHTNPTNTTPLVFSTVHANVPSALPSTWLNEASVVDGPDSKYISPGADPEVFYWNASGVSETEYQDVNTFNNHGGLRYYVPQVTTSAQAAVVVVEALVVFRGRH